MISRMCVMSGSRAEEAVSAFLGYLRGRGHRSGTQRQYGRYLNLFARWAGDREPDAITAREIEPAMG